MIFTVGLVPPLGCLLNPWETMGRRVIFMGLSAYDMAGCLLYSQFPVYVASLFLLSRRLLVACHNEIHDSIAKGYLTWRLHWVWPSSMYSLTENLSYYNAVIDDSAHLYIVFEALKCTSVQSIFPTLSIVNWMAAVPRSSHRIFSNF